MRSHDLHEVRGMNRLVAYSDADIVVLAQDDDLPPAAADQTRDSPGEDDDQSDDGGDENGGGGSRGGGGGEGVSGSAPRGRWLEEIRALFCQHPRLALVGGKRGFKPHPSAERFLSKPLKSFGYGWWKKMRSLPTKPIQHHDPSLGLPFMFVAAVNMGPLVVRRGAFLSVSEGDDEHPLKFARMHRQVTRVYRRLTRTHRRLTPQCLKKKAASVVSPRCVYFLFFMTLKFKIRPMTRSYQTQR